MFNNETIQHIANLLIGRGHTIAVAESVTAGLFQNALSSAERASEFFEGGMTAYNITQKYTQLHIHPAHAVSCNCVSEQVAGEMALAIVKAFQSDWGIGVTGYASPLPGHDMKVFACFAVVLHNKILLSETVTSSKATPLEVQVDYVDQVNRELLALIKSYTG